MVELSDCREQREVVIDKDVSPIDSSVPIVETKRPGGVVGFNASCLPTELNPSDYTSEKINLAINTCSNTLSKYDYHMYGATFNVDKKRPIQKLFSTADQILKEGIRIQCVEACFVALLLTDKLLPVIRFAISFESKNEEKTYRHLVLGLKYGDMFGSLGISRNCGLMTKSLSFCCLQELLDDFIKHYKKDGHVVSGITFSKPIPHGSPNTVVHWNFFSLQLQFGEPDSHKLEVQKFASRGLEGQIPFSGNFTKTKSLTQSFDKPTPPRGRKSSQSPSVAGRCLSATRFRTGGSPSPARKSVSQKTPRTDPTGKVTSRALSPIKKVNTSQTSDNVQKVLFQEDNKQPTECPPTPSQKQPKNAASPSTPPAQPTTKEETTSSKSEKKKSTTPTLTVGEESVQKKTIAVPLKSPCGGQKPPPSNKCTEVVDPKKNRIGIAPKSQSGDTKPRVSPTKKRKKGSEAEIPNPISSAGNLDDEIELPPPQKMTNVSTTPSENESTTGSNSESQQTKKPVAVKTVTGSHTSPSSKQKKEITPPLVLISSSDSLQSTTLTDDLSVLNKTRDEEPATPPSCKQKKETKVSTAVKTTAGSDVKLLSRVTAGTQSPPPLVLISSSDNQQSTTLSNNVSPRPSGKRKEIEVPNALKSPPGNKKVTGLTNVTENKQIPSSIDTKNEIKSTVTLKASDDQIEALQSSSSEKQNEVEVIPISEGSENEIKIAIPLKLASQDTNLPSVLSEQQDTNRISSATTPAVVSLSGKQIKEVDSPSVSTDSRNESNQLVNNRTVAVQKRSLSSNRREDDNNKPDVLNQLTTIDVPSENLSATIKKPKPRSPSRRQQQQKEDTHLHSQVSNKTEEQEKTSSSPRVWNSCTRVVSDLKGVDRSQKQTKKRGHNNLIGPFATPRKMKTTDSGRESNPNAPDFESDDDCQKVSFSSPKPQCQPQVKTISIPLHMDPSSISDMNTDCVQSQAVNLNSSVKETTQNNSDVPAIDPSLVNSFKTAQLNGFKNQKNTTNRDRTAGKKDKPVEDVTDEDKPVIDPSLVASFKAAQLQSSELPNDVFKREEAISVAETIGGFNKHKFKRQLQSPLDGYSPLHLPPPSVTLYETGNGNSVPPTSKKINSTQLIGALSSIKKTTKIENSTSPETERRLKQYIAEEEIARRTISDLEDSARQFKSSVMRAERESRQLLGNDGRNDVESAAVLLWKNVKTKREFKKEADFTKDQISAFLSSERMIYDSKTLRNDPLLEYLSTVETPLLTLEAALPDLITTLANPNVVKCRSSWGNEDRNNLQKSTFLHHKAPRSAHSIGWYCTSLAKRWLRTPQAVNLKPVSGSQYCEHEITLCRPTRIKSISVISSAVAVQVSADSGNGYLVNRSSNICETCVDNGNYNEVQLSLLHVDLSNQPLLSRVKLLLLPQRISAEAFFPLTYQSTHVFIEG